MIRIVTSLLCGLALSASFSASAGASEQAWRLAGTMLQDDGAAIVVADGVHRRLNTGDTFEDCQLLSVARRHARFRCAGTERQIALGAAMDAALSSTLGTALGAASRTHIESPPLVQQRINTSVALERDAVLGIVRDRQRLVAELNLEPVVRDAVVAGYRLLAAPSGSLAVQAGFERGDILRSVNGEAVNGGAFASMLNNLEDQQQISIGFERHGQSMQTVVLLR